MTATRAQLLGMQTRFSFSTDDKKPAAEGAEAKKEETKEEAPKKPVDDKKEKKKDAAESSSSSSSDEEGPESLSKSDVQKIKKLIGVNRCFSIISH